MNHPMHLIEVERKRELHDPDRLRRRLLELGFHEAGQLTEIDTYYSRPDVDYVETVECLRVRQRDGFAEITYKPPSDVSTHSADAIISKQETNVALSGADQADVADQLLTAIGMITLVRVEKARATYMHADHGAAVVSIDTVVHAGTFVETEITAADADAASIQLNNIEEQLGIADHPIVRLPYRDMVISGLLH